MPCGFDYTSTHTPFSLRDDPHPVIIKNKKLQGLSTVNKTKAIYDAHKKGYKTMRIWSANLGELNVDAYDIGQGWAAMQSIVKGKKGHPDIFVKEIDSVKHSLQPQNYKYNIEYLAQLQPTFINIKKCEENGKIIETLEAMKKICELSNTKLSPPDQKKLHDAKIYNNVVDVHFNACNCLDFLHNHTSSNNVTSSNVLISIHNVEHLDNAFWTGEYMVYGNGDNLFTPLGTSDIGGHESGHGCVEKLAGLRYRGESGALNEHFADVIGVCNEFFTYYKYNANLDGDTSDDIKGKSDWLIGEDAGKKIKYLRNMADPNNADIPQPKHYKGKYWGDPNDEKNDYGYVHSNSGVGNWCFYNIAIKIGWREAFRIFWACLEQLSPDSSYTDYRDYLKLCAGKHIDVVKMALLKVGLGDHIISDWVCPN